MMKLEAVRPTATVLWRSPIVANSKVELFGIHNDNSFPSVSGRWTGFFPRQSVRVPLGPILSKLCLYLLEIAVPISLATFPAIAVGWRVCFVFVALGVVWAG